MLVVLSTGVQQLVWLPTACTSPIHQQPVASAQASIATLLGTESPTGHWFPATPLTHPHSPSTGARSIAAGTPSHARMGATAIDADARRQLYNNPLLQLPPGQGTLVHALQEQRVESMGSGDGLQPAESVWVESTGSMSVPRQPTVPGWQQRLLARQSRYGIVVGMML